MSRTTRYVVALAVGWPLYWWVRAGEDHFSADATDFAIAMTALWLVLGAAAVLRGRRERQS